MRAKFSKPKQLRPASMVQYILSSACPVSKAVKALRSISLWERGRNNNALRCDTNKMAHLRGGVSVHYKYIHDTRLSFQNNFTRAPAQEKG